MHQTPAPCPPPAPAGRTEMGVAVRRARSGSAPGVHAACPSRQGAECTATPAHALGDPSSSPLPPGPRRAWRWVMTGIDCASNTRKRLAIVSALSSARPLVWLRPASRARASSSLTANTRAEMQGCTWSSNASSCRGRARGGGGAAGDGTGGANNTLWGGFWPPTPQEGAPTHQELPACCMRGHGPGCGLQAGGCAGWGGGCACGRPLAWSSCLGKPSIK